MLRDETVRVELDHAEATLLAVDGTGEDAVPDVDQAHRVEIGER
jgi:hypothetical protein